MTKAEEYRRGNQYLFRNTLLRIVEVAKEKYLLQFEKQFDLKAGQVVAVAIDKRQAPRIYSICSGELRAMLLAAKNRKWI